MIPIFIVAAVVSILQLTAVAYAKIGPPALNLPIIVLVFFSFRKGPLAGASLGVFFGLFNSFFNISSTWTDVLLYSAVGLAVGEICRWFYKENLLAFVFVVFCSQLFIYSSYFLFNVSHFPAGLNIADCVFRLALPGMIYNIFASVFLFYFLRGLNL